MNIADNFFTIIILPDYY